MSIQRYSVNQHPIQTLLTWIKSDEIAIPEIQRPFVWSAAKVRDFLDSLYQGYPVGYLIAWRNPNVKLKDGSISAGKRILIDGQQRMTALMAAFLGQTVINKDYRRVQIRIAFHPQDRRFEVTNPAIRRDNAWIADVAEVMAPDVRMLQLVNTYCERNPSSDQDEVYQSIELLRSMVNNPIGLIELNSDLDIEAVTEIFIRINSAGVELSQADFAMSKIAANEQYGGNRLRKCIDYFCHLAVAPEFFQQLTETDPDFAQTAHFQKMAWLKRENDDLYDPSYTDMLRVAFTSEFKRGRLQDLVALLSGRNFETRDYEEDIAASAFEQLERGILNFMNETHFKRFSMILRSTGFIESSMIRSKNAINFAYIVYLVLKGSNAPPHEIESLVRRWFVMAVLTGRYSSSPETAFAIDIRQIDEIGVARYLENIEQAELSDAFWNAGLPQQMNTSVASSPYFNAYLAAQVYMGDKGFLSRDISVMDLVTHRGDIHHIFPREYLKKHGLKRGQYNQIANYVIMQSEINITIGAKAPSVYFSQLTQQCQNGQPQYGALIDEEALQLNFSMNCIPDGMETKEVDQYGEFLEERRKLMAAKLKIYYQTLGQR